MEQLYSETYLKAKPAKQRIAARIALMALCVLLVFVDLFVIQSIFALIFIIILDAVILVAMPTKNIAYEYVFVDGQIDFDVIYNGNRRKNQKRIDLDKADLIAPEESGKLYNYKNTPLSDYSSRIEGDKAYIIVYKGEKGEERIKFTPDEKMLENIKIKARMKVDY